MFIPSVHELFETSPESGPYAYALREIRRRADEIDDTPLIFRPWCPLEESGEIDAQHMARLFAAWSREESTLPPEVRLCFPIILNGGIHDPYLETNSKTGRRLLEPPYILGLMKNLPSEGGWYVHHACHEIGAINVYGGWRSEFDQLTKLCGPCILGRCCRVRYGTRITWSVLGHKVRVAGRVSRSVIGDKTTIEPGAVVGDSIIGKNCLIGASVVIRSHNSCVLPRPEIVIQDARVPYFVTIPTGRTICGAIIGDGCDVFANLEPGTVLGKGCKVTARMHGRLPAGIYSREVLECLDRILVQRNETDLKQAILASQSKVHDLRDY